MKIVCASTVVAAKPIFSMLGSVEIIPEAEITAQDLTETDVLIVRSKTNVDEKLLQGTKVRVVGTATSGHDHFDVDYLKRQGILWGTAAGSNANSVAEYVVAALLHLSEAKNLILAGKTLAIIGAGHVGSCLQAKARLLGLTVLLNDPPLKQQTDRNDLLPLDDVLAQADIVSLHVPLTSIGEHPTLRMVNQEFLNKLKLGCVFINASRGEVVNEATLQQTIENKKLGAVVLDVWDHEPAINTQLLALADIATPHIAGYSFDALLQGSLQIYHFVCESLSITPSKFIDNVIEAEPQVLQVLTSATDLPRLINSAYDIMQDHRALSELAKMEPEEQGKYFKRLRNQYRKRWEFKHYPVALQGEAETLKPTIESLGFKYG